MADRQPNSIHCMQPRKFKVCMLRCFKTRPWHSSLFMYKERETGQKSSTVMLPCISPMSFSCDSFGILNQLIKTEQFGHWNLRNFLLKSVLITLAALGSPENLLEMQNCSIRSDLLSQSLRCNKHPCGAYSRRSFLMKVFGFLFFLSLSLILSNSIMIYLGVFILLSLLLEVY